VLLIPSAFLPQCDLKALVSKVDEVYENWRAETLVLFGGSDSYVSQQSAFDFLDTKRTSMKIQTFEAKVGHMPQEDYPEVLCKKLLSFLSGEVVKAVSPGTRIPGNFTDSKSA
jgi:pimeloyl-ACP methyl ester carboxylesterase